MTTFARARSALAMLTGTACLLAAGVADARPAATFIGGDNGWTGGHVTSEGKRLYVGAYGLGMRIFDISNPADPEQIGQWTGPAAPAGARNVRADTVPDAMVYGNREIAVLGGTRRNTNGPEDARTDRTEFLDVTDPARPVLLADFVDQKDGESHNADIVDERRLFLPSGGSAANGLRIYDMTPTLTTPPAQCDLAKRPRTDNPCAPVNIARFNPVELWKTSPYRSENEPVGEAFQHTHDVTIYTDYKVRGLPGKRDIVLLAEGGSYLRDNANNGSVFVIDITDPRAPVVLYRWLHETGPSHHPIRYVHEAQFLEGDPKVMLTADEDLHNGCGAAGGVVAVRLADDLQSSVELSEWFVPRGTPAPVCSVHVMDSDGSYLFLGSYNAGLQVVDYRDPTKPCQVDADILPGSTAWGAHYRKGYVYVGDMSRGLDTFKWEDEAARGAADCRPPPVPALLDSALGAMAPVPHHQERQAEIAKVGS